MSKYKGLFTFDEDNHRYIPIAQADGIIDTMDYEPDSKPAEPLIKDEKIRKAVRAWAEANSLKWAAYSADGKFYDKTIDIEISFKTYTNRLDIPECRLLPIAELCGEKEE